METVIATPNIEAKLDHVTTENKSNDNKRRHDEISTIENESTLKRFPDEKIKLDSDTEQENKRSKIDGEDSTKIESTSTEEKKEFKFYCDHDGCKFGANTKAQLRSHKYTHGLRPFKCDYPGCQYTGSKASYLVLHKRMHTKEKPYKCNYGSCTYAAACSSDLLRHKRTHTGEKPYKCTYPGCTYASTQQGNLVAHKKTHQGDRPFKCDFPGCIYKATKLANLAKHRGKHKKELQRQSMTLNSGYASIQGNNLVGNVIGGNGTDDTAGITSVLQQQYNLQGNNISVPISGMFTIPNANNMNSNSSSMTNLYQQGNIQQINNGFTNSGDLSHISLKYNSKNMPTKIPFSVEQQRNNFYAQRSFAGSFSNDYNNVTSIPQHTMLNVPVNTPTNMNNYDLFYTSSNIQGYPVQNQPTFNGNLNFNNITTNNSLNQYSQQFISAIPNSSDQLQMPNNLLSLNANKPLVLNPANNIISNNDNNVYRQQQMPQRLVIMQPQQEQARHTIYTTPTPQEDVSSYIVNNDNVVVPELEYTIKYDPHSNVVNSVLVSEK